MSIVKLKEFLEGSSICFFLPGNYNISDDLFITAYEEFLKSGKDVLDEHMLLTYMSWDDPTEDIIYDKEQLQLLDDLLNGKTFWALSNFFESKNEVEQLLFRKNKLYEKYEAIRSRRAKKSKSGKS